MTLSHTIVGRGTPATFIHGFTQTKESWLPVVDKLDSVVSMCLVDAPGHGGSHSGQRTLPECGDEIARIMPPGVLVGYSMGARMALHTALQHPKSVSHLVLISGTGGIDDETEREQRKQHDEDLAQHIVSVGTQAFIDEWLNMPMFAGLSNSMSNKEQRYQNSPQGLADSLRYAGTGTQKPLWNSLAQLTMPVLVVSGDLDAKFTELATRLSVSITDSTLHVVPHAGHTVHLEQTDSFCDLLLTWLYAVNAINNPAV